ncbi:unnamed protein product [Meganyctiphanes norvegica]|uniref:Uncharacterized protein n=1 Tax=Meganyctiphanes norvegica TaxID=48144 RepID=A0AAV2Q5S2_MEGNR
MHVKTSKHVKFNECIQGVVKFETFVKPIASDIAVTESECLVVNFLIEHNVPVSVADHLSELVMKICSDSSIAKKFKCKRTKTTHIMHEMSRDIISNLGNALKTEPFSISTDGSESKSRQLYPILVRYPDLEHKKVVTK